MKQFRRREKQNSDNSAATISQNINYDEQTITEESKVLQSDVSQENLGKFIPFLAGINIAGFFVISFLNNLWPMQGELTNYPGEFLSLALGIISLIAGIIFFFGNKNRWRATTFATIIVTCNYIMLGYLLVQAPDEDWTFGYLGIVIVACGVFFSQKLWWIINVTTGWITLVLCGFLAQYYHHGTIFWRTGIIMLFFSTMVSIAAYFHKSWQANTLSSVTVQAVKTSHYDKLTGVLNRTGVYEYVRPLMNERRKRGEKAYVTFVDMDGLKHINDTFGHEFGDAAIEIVAQSLERVTRRENDWVARWGGDEFVVLSVGDFTTIENFTKRLNELLTKECAHQSLPFPIKVSVGGKNDSNDPTVTVKQLLVEADLDMYRRRRALRFPDTI